MIILAWVAVGFLGLNVVAAITADTLQTRITALLGTLIYGPLVARVMGWL